VLTVEGIDVYYGDVRTLWEVSLQVRSGEMVALVGGNGAGKTTTLRTISGLLRPRRGAVSFDGRPTAGFSAHTIADLGMGHVPEGRQLFPLMTVEENLLLGSYLPRTRPRRPQNLEMVYAQFPILKERAGQDAGTLSGGEQQMLAIGRALMSEPRLLILDEPSLGLAPLVVSDVFSAIERIRRQGITVLLVEQNVSKALAIADRAYVLENGRVVLQGTGAELLTRPDIKRAYLGV
jgi:branched-chain amino acid transport system ATP-binding protein